MTSRRDRRLKWATKVKKFEHLPRVTLKGLRHTHATMQKNASTSSQAASPAREPRYGANSALAPDLDP